MELQRVCQDIVGETQGVLACLLVDLDTGLTLAEARRAGVELEAEWLARSACLIFRGGHMSQFVSALSPQRSLAEYMKEAQITTANSRQFLSVLPVRPNTVLVLVTEKAMSIGLGWMAVHQSEGRFGAPADTQAPLGPEAARATRVRAGQAPQRLASSPRSEPRVAAPATSGDNERPYAQSVVEGHRDRAVAQQADAVADRVEKAESDNRKEPARKEPAEVGKRVNRVGARAILRQKT